MLTSILEPDRASSVCIGEVLATHHSGVMAWAAQTGSLTDLFESVIEKLTDSL